MICLVSGFWEVFNLLSQAVWSTTEWGKDCRWRENQPKVRQLPLNLQIPGSAPQWTSTRAISLCTQRLLPRVLHSQCTHNFFVCLYFQDFSAAPPPSQVILLILSLSVKPSINGEEPGLWHSSGLSGSMGFRPPCPVYWDFQWVSNHT